MLSDKDEEISQLKNYNQNLKDKIKKFEDNEESLYITDNDLEEDIKRLNKLIMDKYDEFAQIQRKLKSQELEICRHLQQKEEFQQKYDDTKKKHKLEIVKINGKLASNTEELF